MSYGKTINEACGELHGQYLGREWYHSIGHNNNDTIIVYTNKKLNGAVHTYYGYKIRWVFAKKSVK